MPYLFNLAGLDDKILEASIYQDIETRGYSEKEIADIRTPIPYHIYDYLFSPNELQQSLLKWQNLATLEPNLAVPSEKNIKATVKRLLAKAFKWYIVPIAVSQTYINREITQNMCDLTTYLLMQERIIDQLIRALNKKCETNV